MSATRAFVALSLRSRARRMLAVAVFGVLFLTVAATMRLIGSNEGHVEADALFAIGGYPLVSGVLLIGWLLGRFPIFAVLALVGGIFAVDRTRGWARLYLVRPVSPLRLYAARWAALAAIAFAVCATLMPLFDLLMLGTWAGPATFVLIAAHVLVYGGLVALLSVWTRADIWVTTALAIASIVWDALRRADALDIPAGGKSFVSMILPPQAALHQIESAFGQLQPIPWDAFAFCAGYGMVMLILAGLSLEWREY